MGIVVRQSFKTVVLTYLGAILGVVNMLWLFPLVLAPEQVGLVTMLISIAVGFSSFALLGAGNIPNRFFPYFKDETKQHNGFLFFILTIAVIGFSVFTVFYYIFKREIAAFYMPKAPLLVHYFYLLLPFTGIVVFNTLIESYLVIQQRPVVPNFVREVLLRLLMGTGVVAILFHWMDFNGYVFLVVGSYVLGLVTLLFYAHREHLLFLTPDLTIFRSRYIKSILVYAGFILMGNASGAIIQNIDSIMLGAYRGLYSVGVYKIAFLVASVIEIPKRSLSQVLVPMVSAANRRKDTATLEILYKKSSINQAIIGGLLFLGIWANVDNIYRLIPNGGMYMQGKWVIFYIGLAKVFDMITGINSEIIGTSRYYRMDLVFYVMLGAIGIAANFILIPLYDITGAAMAMAVSVFLFNTARFFYILVKFGIHPFSANTVKILVLAAGVLLGNAVLPSLPNVIADIVVRSSYIAIAFLGLSYAMELSVDINQTVAKVMRAALHTFGGR
jgi:O-antigen/teichoic acid export membrane protein